MAWTIGVYWLLMGLSGFHSISSTFAIVHQQVINDTTPLISNSTLSTWPPPPGVLREAAPITSLMLAQLELTPDTHLYAQAGRQALVRFSLRNLDSLPRRFAISLQEHRGRPEDDSFQPQLSDQRPFLNPNETRVITVFLQIPPLSTTLEEERPTPTYTIEVQPLGTTTSGAANMLVRRFNFPVIENTDEEVAVKYLSDWTVPHCQTSEQVVSPTCLNVSQDLQKCGKYTWRGQLQIQDRESGLRSVKVDALLPTEAFYYSYDNFNLGSTLPSSLFVQSNCCQSLISVQVTDLAGNSQACQIALQENNDFSSAMISTVVFVLVTVCLIVAITVSIFYMRRRCHQRVVDLGESA